MLFFVPALMTAGLLFVPGAWEFSFLRWIPYSSYEFFIVMIPAALLMSAARGLFKSESLWTGALWLFNFVYLLFFFSHPVQAFFYAFWSFAILKTKEKYPGPTWAYLLLLLLPMFLKHSAKEIQFWGLSYATFRAFHLAMEPQQAKGIRFRDYLIFIFYFPSLLAGPIDRWPRFRQALKDSFTAPRVPSLKLAYQFLLLGLAQKFVLAEALRRYVLPTSIENFRQGIIGFYSYPLYLYLDFAGYSALAIGFSLLLGVSLPLNFDRPYLAQNPQDFWRRFHITLGEWLRDYFFKPLYLLLSKRKALAPYPLLRQNLALFSTFFLMGLWNGTQKHFLISGALFGAYSVVHNIFVYRAKQKGIRFLSPAFVWLSRFVMLHAACLALFIFCQQMWEKH